MSALEAEPMSFVHDTDLADVMREVGGMWRAKPRATIDEIFAEVEHRGIKAMYFAW